MINSRYLTKVETTSYDRWYSILDSFSDSSIYQTPSYAINKWSNCSVSNIVIERDGVSVSCAQVIILKVPIIKIKIAYIPYGPIWKNDYKSDEDSLNRILFALKEEYVYKRNCYLIITPKIIKNSLLEKVLQNNHYIPRKSQPHYKTVLIDLDNSIDMLRSNMNKRWRRTLNKAEKNKLIVNTDTSQHSFDSFLEIYNEMYSKKKFAKFISPVLFKQIEEHLPQPYKLKITICYLNNNPVAGMVWSAMGDTGINLFVASTVTGKTIGASAFVYWTVLKELKKAKYRYFDLGGINEHDNPGGFQFKSSMGGEVVEYIGQYDYCKDLHIKVIVLTLEFLKVLYRRIRIQFKI